MIPEKLESTIILWCNYDLWKGQIGRRLIQEFLTGEKEPRKAAANANANANANASANVDDEFDSLTATVGSGLTDDAY